MNREPPAELPPIPPGYADRMPPVSDASELICVGTDSRGRPLLLTPAAADAWAKMCTAAARDVVSLHLISAFRSEAHQREIVLNKLRAGQSLAAILRVNAYPGHSEHHSGCAVDIGTPAARDLEEDFADTPAFAWLQARARSFGFSLSYPRENDAGVIFEPWHWRHAPGVIGPPQKPQFKLK